MYFSQDYVTIPLFERALQEGFKEIPTIDCCNFGMNIEQNRAFRIKLLKTAGISVQAEPVIKDSISITTELWFNGTEITNVCYIMFDKHLMEGNKGPMVSCMGSVYWEGNEKNKIFKDGVGRLLPFLKRVNYVGPIALTTLVTKDKYYASDITATLSYNSTFVMLEMYRGKTGSFLIKLANNKLEKLEFKSKIGIGVDLSVMPFPSAPSPHDNIYPIEGLNKFNLKHFWGYDITGIRGKYQTTRKGGRIGTITARGDDIAGFSPLRDARRRVYRTINNITIPGLMYRLDIGSRVEADKQKLIQWGWLGG